jgi:hypothetical protein
MNQPSSYAQISNKEYQEIHNEKATDKPYSK